MFAVDWHKFGSDFRHPIHVAEILVVALILRLVLWRSLKRLVRHLVERPLTRRQQPTEVQLARLEQRTKTITSLLSSVGSFVIWSIAVIMVFSEIGPNIAPLIAGGAVAGAALGFGAQQLVRDVLAGISMLAEDQFGIGDEIDVVDIRGVVEDVGLRTTKLRTEDGVLWFVPNGEIKRLGNRSATA